MAIFKVEILSKLNGREGPSSSFPLVEKMKKGEIFVSSKQTNQWFYIDEKFLWVERINNNQLKILEVINGTPPIDTGGDNDGENTDPDPPKNPTPSQPSSNTNIKVNSRGVLTFMGDE